jgi:hypothetical protein
VRFITQVSPNPFAWRMKCPFASSNRKIRRD